MERKTKVTAGEGRQDLLITRDFELPVDLLFKAYTEAELVEQWMGTRVVKLENREHGGWRFETRDAQGRVVFAANGVIHQLEPQRRIVRTFELDNTPFPAQLEFMEFEATGEDRSRLTIQIIYKSAGHRDQMLKLPFAQGLGMAHARLQNLFPQIHEQ